MTNPLHRLVIAKDGYSISDNLQERYKSFDSKWLHAQYKLENLGTLEYSSDATQEVDHNLSYLPQFLTFIKKSGDSYWRALYYNDTVHTSRITDTKLKVFAKNGDKVRYVVLNSPIETSVAGVKFIQEPRTLAVAPEGTSLDNCVEHEVSYYSGWGTLLIIKRFNINLSVTGSGVFTGTQAHGLNYTPMFTGQILTPFVVNVINPFVLTDFFTATSMEIEIDDTNIRAKVDTVLDDVYTARFRIQLLSEKLE